MPGFFVVVRHLDHPPPSRHRLKFLNSLVLRAGLEPKSCHQRVILNPNKESINTTQRTKYPVRSFPRVRNRHIAEVQITDVNDGSSAEADQMRPRRYLLPTAPGGRKILTGYMVASAQQKKYKEYQARLVLRAIGVQPYPAPIYPEFASHGRQRF